MIDSSTTDGLVKLKLQCGSSAVYNINLMHNDNNSIQFTSIQIEGIAALKHSFLSSRIHTGRMATLKPKRRDEP